MRCTIVGWLATCGRFRRIASPIAGAPQRHNNPGVEPAVGERRGIYLLILSALAFSAMSVQVKLAGRELPVATLVLARGAVALVLSIAVVRVQRIPFWGRDRPTLVVRALFGIGGLACFFYALTVLPLAEVTVLHYLNPIFTAVIARIVLGERSNRRLIVAIALCLAGTIAVTRPGALFGEHAPLPLAGVLAALGGALFSAFAYTTVRRLSRTDHPDVIVFYFSLLATIAALPFAAFHWVWPTTRGWLLLVGIGTATQLGQVTLTRGLARVPAARGTTVGYVQIVFATIWGALLFGEKLNVWTIVGALLVLIAVVLLFRPTLAPAGADDHSTPHVERAAQGTKP
jgi:drug/metabolite transporter (DMT)-like permease